jgi:serine/threonine protein kinase
MGAVYEAVQESIGRRVALKILHPKFASDPAVMTRFFNEARAVNIIEHPGLVQCSDFGRTPDGTAYLVMEFLKGETLGERIKRLKKLPLTDALHIGSQLAAALAAAHTHGIVHRDIKPSNVLLVANPAVPSGEQAKILDFGIAKLLDENLHQGAALTETGKILGTPQYMAPEQAKTTRVDGRADVYSVGVLLYEMLSGQLPFPREAEDTAWAVLVKKMSDEPIDLAVIEPSLPKEVTGLVMSLLVRQPAARPTMAELEVALCHLLGLDPTRRSGFHATVSAVEDPGDSKTIDAPQQPSPEKKIASPTASTLGGPLTSSAKLLLLFLAVASSVATWALLHDWSKKPAPAPASPDLGLVDLKAPPQDLAAPPDLLMQPPDMAHPPTRSRSHCSPRQIDASCILSAMAAQQKAALVTALHENGGVHLCPGERLAITGLPQRPAIEAAASWLKRQTPGPFMDALRGLDGSFPARVEIQCSK